MIQMVSTDVFLKQSVIVTLNITGCDHTSYFIKPFDNFVLISYITAEMGLKRQQVNEEATAVILIARILFYAYLILKTKVCLKMFVLSTLSHHYGATAKLFLEFSCLSGLPNNMTIAATVRFETV